MSRVLQKQVFPQANCLCFKTFPSSTRSKAVSIDAQTNEEDPFTEDYAL